MYSNTNINYNNFFSIYQLTIVDMVIYTFVAEFVGADVAVRGSRVLRPLLLINFPEMRLVSVVD